MSARVQQVLTTVILGVVAILNGTLGWHLDGMTILALAVAAVGLVLAIGHVEASHGGSLAQDWAEIKPALQAFLSAASSAVEVSKPAATETAVQPQQTSAGLPASASPQPPAQG